MCKISVLVVGMGLVLSGCATGPTGPVSGTGILSPLVDAGIIQQSTREKAVAVQQQASAICGYIPTLATVAAIFSAGVGGTIGAIASGLCGVVTTAPLAEGGSRAAYYRAPNGKTIRLRGTLNGRKV